MQVRDLIIEEHNSGEGYKAISKVLNLPQRKKYISTPCWLYQAFSHKKDASRGSSCDASSDKINS